MIPRSIGGAFSIAHPFVALGLVGIAAMLAVLAGCGPSEPAGVGRGNESGSSSEQTTGSDVRSTTGSTADQGAELGLAGGVAAGPSAVGATEIWRRTLGIPVASGAAAPVAVRDEVVAVALADGTVKALSLADGEPLWAASFAETPIGVWATATGFLVALPNSLATLDPTSGEEHWSYALQVSDAVTTGNTIYVANHVAAVLALDGATGELLWESDTGAIGPPSGAPVQKDGAIYVAYQSGRVVALDGADGNLIWGVDLDRELSSGVAVGVIEIVVAAAGGSVIALDRGNGSEAQEMTSEEVVLAAPLPFGDELIVSGGAGTIVVFDGANRRELAALSSHLAGSPMIVGGTLIAAESLGYMNGFDVKTGERLWRTNVPGRVVGSPVLLGDTLVVATADGSVVGLTVTSGQ